MRMVEALTAISYLPKLSFEHWYSLRWDDTYWTLTVHKSSNNALVFQTFAKTPELAVEALLVKVM